MDLDGVINIFADKLTRLDGEPENFRPNAMRLWLPKGLEPFLPLIKELARDTNLVLNTVAISGMFPVRNS